MIIRSIRLKNIKSYGEGADGNGVTVSFEPGINRIAGKNGHGKSTLIESLGYALFLTEPIYEEGFDLATYLVRTGKKAGEIDLVFDFGGRTYRLERGLGSQNKRRSKVVVVSDGSTEAEGDAEVSAYLCRLFGFPDEARLSELFSKLVGVKQGRLTWPFDSKPSEARRHFEPLLDVEIFRQCFDRLKPVVDRFEEMSRQSEKEQATVDERIRERADSPEKVKAREQEVDDLEKKVGAARDEKAGADRQKQIHEGKEQAYREAKALFDAASNSLKLAAQKSQQDEQRVKESQEAAGAVQATQAAYEIFVKAEQSVRQLQERQIEKSRLQNQRGDASNSKTAWDGKAVAARQQAGAYGEQKDSKVKRVNDLRLQIAEGHRALLDTKADFDRLSATTETARRSRDSLNHWMASLEGDVQKNAALLDGILEDWRKVAAWNVNVLIQAREEEKNVDNAAKDLARKLTEARKLAETLSGQLEQISGGVCPFLKEKCQQFDPKKVRSDVSMRETEIKSLANEQAEASEAHKRTKALVEKLAKDEAALSQLRKSIRQDVESFVAAHNSLFSAATQGHFAVLQDFVPKHASLLQIQLLGDVKPADGYDESGTELAVEALQQLGKLEEDLCSQVSSALEKTAADLKDSFIAFEIHSAKRLGLERDLANGQEKLNEAESEIKDLAGKIENQNTVAAKADEEADAAGRRTADLDEQLKPFANLENDLRDQQGVKDQHAESHRNYLGAKPVADRLEDCLAAIKQSRESETQAADLLRQKQDGYDLAKQEFDPAALATARKQAEDAGSRLAADSANWQNAQKELKREKARFAEWQTSCQERNEIMLGLGRLQACVELTQKARQILQKTAPMVAQHVCRRIAARAQQIFNQINPEPVELEWNAERYSLRISPGERRFAMLSGGEQTKLALAMTLAMIEDFSSLKFCIFDEPTYGVDADSRQKLAGAIVAVQQTTRFDQLLIVSHDDAFEGHVENTVLLKKTTAEGSLASRV